MEFNRGNCEIFELRSISLIREGWSPNSRPNATPFPAPSWRGDIELAVYVEKLRLVAAGRFDVSVDVFVGALAVVSLQRFFPAWTIAAWVALFIVILIGRDQLQRRYRRAVIDAQASRVWGMRFTAVALATGVLWGLVAATFLRTESAALQVLALCICGGMAIGSMARYAPFRPAMLAYFSPIILFAVVILLVKPDLVHVEIDAMICVFGAILTVTSGALSRMVGDHLRLRLELDISQAELANARAIARIGSWEAPAGGGAATWSAEMFQILDLDPATAPSADLILERVHPADQAAVRAAYEEWRSDFQDFALDHRLSLGDGTVRWVHQFGLTQRDGAGRPSRQTAILQDITERKKAEEELQLANIVLETQMEASEYGVLVVDEDQQIISCNERFAKVWDFPAAILNSRSYDAVRAAVMASVKDRDPAGVISSLFADDAGPDAAEDIETVGGRSLRRRSVVLHSAEGRRLGRAWFFSDVTEQKRALAQAIRTSRIDHLTGLANRGAFVEALEAAIAAAEAQRRGFAVLYLDLDHFKDVNDTLGHPAGDKLLEAVAGRLRAATRASDTVARFGGDEFAIIADGVVATDGASALAASLIAALGEPYVVGDVPVRSSASIGIALHTPGSADAETMLSQADLALYQAKTEGRSEYRFFTPAIESEVRTRVELAAELHDAIAGDQLFLLYQPQVELAGGRLVGVEALVRWRHPQRGLLPPELFVPVAERTGVIGKLGRWVLQAACRQARAWLDAGAPPTRLAVNVSSLQFRAALAFEADIEAALSRNRLAPELIELELTETVLMNAFREQADLLGRLRAQGMTIAIDDFGTGYSSLDYLRRFPVNRIKIDQTFVSDLEADSGDAAIVKATIGLARELGVQVIAEGVERPGQLDLLRSWGCGEVQGFHIAPPLTPDEIAPLLHNRRPLI